MAAVVEKWNPHARIRQDLFGFADVLAIQPGQVGVLAIQACITGDQSKRVAKIHSDALAKTVNAWLIAGNRISVWGWSKKGPRGKRKVWELSATAIGPAGEAR